MSDSRLRWLPFRITAARVSGAALLVMVLACLGTLPWSLAQYDHQDLGRVLEPPGADGLAPAASVMGTDRLGRSLAARCALGGAISLGVGLSAAAITMVIGTAWGMVAGYFGGKVDSVLMRTVDVLYGLPYILLVVLLSVALEPLATELIGTTAGNVLTLLIAIATVSWLTLARVVRGQVLSLRAEPFVEAAHAVGAPTWRVLVVHMLPNLIGPIVVYTTLTVPRAILQESFLSFLGIGVRPPLPSWGNLAAEGLGQLNPVASQWWVLFWPCLLLAITLLALNFLGDGLRDRFDPKASTR